DAITASQTGMGVLTKPAGGTTSYGGAGSPGGPGMGGSAAGSGAGSTGSLATSTVAAGGHTGVIITGTGTPVTGAAGTGSSSTGAAGSATSTGKGGRESMSTSGGNGADSSVDEAFAKALPDLRESYRLDLAREALRIQ